MSLRPRNSVASTQRAESVDPSDMGQPSSSPNGSHVGVILAALHHMTRSWGTTLRFVTIVVVVGVVMRMLVGPIPWDRLTSLLELGR